MSAPRPRPRRRFAFSRAVMALMLREMSSTYGRSPGGYIWAILEPVAGIAVFTIVLSFIARVPPLGDNFPLFFATGILVFTFYQSTTTKVGSAIRYSRPLLAYPTVSYIDAIAARLILNVLTQITVLTMVFTGIVWGFGLHLLIDYIAIGQALGMAVALGAGVGLLNCFLMSRFPLWQFIWAVANRPIFIVSGIFFLIDPLPAPIRDLLLWNPLAHIIMQMRAGFYSTYDAVHVSQLFVYSISMVLGALGMLLLHRYHRVLLDEGI